MTQELHNKDKLWIFAEAENKHWRLTKDVDAGESFSGPLAEPVVSRDASSCPMTPN